MSFRYGKATFTDGFEAYLVYTDSPGWAFERLFNSPEEALQWRRDEFPELEETNPLRKADKKSTEEPVLILADIDCPHCPALYFYSMASRAGMVITGPKSREDSEYLFERGDVTLSKDFYDLWAESEGEKIEKATLGSAITTSPVKPEKKDAGGYNREF